MPTSEQQPTVAIVLCTYNGSKHLIDQLESLKIQTWPVAVYAFDDNSADNTLDKLKDYADKLNLSVRTNDTNLGYVANFEAGIAHVLGEGHRYIALCDQDDIWHMDKIAKGMQHLLIAEKKLGDDALILTHSDLNLIDANQQQLHESFFKYRRYGISKEKSLALVLGQNGVMGNTVLMNRALAKFALPFPAKLHVHDYWLALLAELYGHRILVDGALVSYRIHTGNASNSSESIPLGNADKRRKKTKNTLFKRNHELPFKEDSRLQVVSLICNDTSRFPALENDDQQVMSSFKDYLEFKQSRIKVLFFMLKYGFFRTGIKHRIRVAYRTLITNRYGQ